MPIRMPMRAMPVIMKLVPVGVAGGVDMIVSDRKVDREMHRQKVLAERRPGSRRDEPSSNPGRWLEVVRSWRLVEWVITAARDSGAPFVTEPLRR
jgi:hypothetical protein